MHHVLLSAALTVTASAAAERFELLNGNEWTIDGYGYERGGQGDRRLATIRIGGRDVGDILIEERLARRWLDGDEWWCRR